MTQPRQRGQAAVELALGLPVVVVVMLAVAQLLVVAHHQLHAELAARTAVRAAAVSAQPSTAATGAAGRHLGVLDHATTTVIDGSMVTVTVTLSGVPRLPLVGAMASGVTPTARATMLFEPP